MGERIRCRKCGDILQSKYRHDFQMCKCGSCYIDGGNDYCRVGGKKEDIEWIDRKDKKKVKYIFENCKEIINKKIYFISDTHFNQRNIIKYFNRPFKDIEEMNNVLIENWNKTITDYDIVFHLGDVALTNESEMKEIIPKLKGKKILIRGNHDKKSKEFFRSVGFEIIPDNPLKLDKEKLILSHKPLADTEIPEGYINVHGHIHNNPLHKINPTTNEMEYPEELYSEKLHINVSVDVINFKPISLEEMRDLYETKYKK